MYVYLSVHNIAYDVKIFYCTTNNQISLIKVFLSYYLIFLRDLVVWVVLIGHNIHNICLRYVKRKLPESPNS